MSNCVKDISHEEAFEFLNEEERGILEKNKTRVRYSKSEVIIKQGSLANSVLFVREGLTQVYVEKTTKKVIISIKGRKNFLGLSSIFQDDNVYQYSATALDECDIDIYHRKSFYKILETNIKFSNEILRYVNHNQSKIFNRFLCLVEKNARGKVADMILCLANNIYGCLNFEIHLTRREMAEFAGLSMENTVRILKEFERDNLIKIKGKNFQVVDVDKLELISEYG